MLKKAKVIRKDQKDQYHPSQGMVTPLLEFVISLSVPLLASSLFISSYFGRNILSLFIFQPNDGWCLTGQRGIGNHCFGDYGVLVAFSGKGMDTVYAANSVTAQYPPLNYFIYSFFREISGASTYKIGLLLFLIILIGGMLLPIVVSFHRRGVETHKIVLVAIGSLSLLPVIMTIDRGNSVGLAIPLIFFYLFPYQHLGKFQRLLIVALLANLKPQFAILIFARFRFNKWKDTLEEVVAILISYAAFFLIGAPHHFLRNVGSFIRALTKYGNVDLNRQFPYNYSFAQGLHNIFHSILGVNLTLAECNVISTSFAVLILILILSKSRFFTIDESSALILPLIILIPTLTFGYYSIVLIPILLLSPGSLELKISDKNYAKIFKKAFITTLIISALPIYLGNDLIAIAGNELNSVQLVIPCMWVVTYLIFVISVFGNWVARLRFTGKVTPAKKFKYSSSLKQ
jgi:hypothetical protein